MKRLLLLLALTAGCQAEPAPPKAMPAATVEHKPTAQVDLPLPDTSIYQLESTWTNQNGKTVKLTDFRGQPVVVAMFFGSCRTACPTIIGDMKRIEAGLSPTVAAKTTLLLVTFDPKVDTPSELKRLEEKFELGEHWVFLHGEPGSIRELATVLDVQYREISEGQFSHTNRITLLDHNGLIASKIDGLKQPSDALVTTLNTFGDK